MRRPLSYSPPISLWYHFHLLGSWIQVFELNWSIHCIYQEFSLIRNLNHLDSNNAFQVNWKQEPLIPQNWILKWKSGRYSVLPLLSFLLAAVKMPGVSMMLILSRTLFGVWTHWNLQSKKYISVPQSITVEGQSRLCDETEIRRAITRNSLKIMRNVLDI